VSIVIVVTGASGFIGAALVRHLAACGVDVTGIDRCAGAVPGVPHVVSDLAEARTGVRRLLARADVVVHLAARPGVRDRSPGIDLARHRDNVLTTREVLFAADGPVVVASSSSVYGGTIGGRASHEDDELRPLGGYARSKAAAESVCTEHRDRGATVCVVRPFTVVGPGQRADMALDRWLRAALAGRSIEVYGRLDRSRDVTDVRDVARAVADLVARAVLGGGLPPVVNLGTGRPRTLGELAGAVRRALPGSRIVHVDPGDEPEPHHTRADIGRCVATLGYALVTDLDDVVAAQLDWLTTDRLIIRGS
jgi:nucleoside-diphosphate-sugar epimerase